MTIQELQAYLDPRLNALQKTIEDITKPIIKDVDRLRVDINDLYEKDRCTRDRLGSIESDVNGLKDDKGDKKHNTVIIVSVVFNIVFMSLAVIAFVI